MSDFILKKVPIESASTPAILYKYRDWDDTFHKRVLLDPSVFLAPPSSFEDNLDCKNNIRFDLLSDIMIFDKFYQQSKKKNIHFDYSEHIKWSFYWFQETPLRNPIEFYRIQTELEIEFNQIFGVLSLTEDSENDEMWIKYANNHSGFCIGYNTAKLFEFLGAGCHVNYVDTLPKIYHDDDYFEQHYKQVFCKLKKWSFEKEYRTHMTWQHKVNIEERNIPITLECIEEIILGEKMSSQNIDEISQIISSIMPNVKIKREK